VGYAVELECPQTVVGEHSEVLYRSGDRLPVDHPDAVGWVPVVVEVDDPPAPPPSPVQTSAPTKTTTAAPAAKTGVKSHE
jgi:hypothetical protein